MSSRARSHADRTPVAHPRLEALGLVDARLPEGVLGMLAMGVRMFLIAIVALAIAAVAFLLATA
jgi:hypothetical protein